MTTPRARTVRHRGQFHQFGLQHDRFKQLIDALSGQRRYIDELRIAAPVVGNHVLRRQLVLHAFRIGAFLVHLVDGNDDRRTRPLSHAGSLLPFAA